MSGAYEEKVYAMAFDFDQEQLGIHYPGGPTNAHEAVRRILEAYGFHRLQGVYFGNESVTPETCIMAVRGVQKRHRWFGKAVSDIRVLRISPGY